MFGSYTNKSQVAEVSCNYCSTTVSRQLYSLELEVLSQGSQSPFEVKTKWSPHISGERTIML